MEKRTGRHGRRKVNVPNLSGLTREQAQAALTAIGFQYSESSTDTSDSNNTNKISSQSVSAGSAILFGSTIPFVYFNYVNPVVITYGPCQDYSTSSSYNCIGGTQNQDVTTTYRRRQILENGVWNGTYDECSASVSTGPAQYTDGRCGYVAPTITYGPCETYGSGTNVGSGTQCNGTYTESYIDYQYNTRKKVYSNGVWDGVSYSTDGCSPTTTRSITGSSQVNGQCGYVTPPTITYGPCEAYGDGTNIGSGTQCNGTYTQSYTDYRYNTRKKVYSDGVWDGVTYSTAGCGTTDSRVINSSSQVDGSCGYVAPVITYGSCEAYGSGTNIGSGTQCNGTYTESYTDYRYNTRKKIYVDGVWDGSSYSTAGCGTTDSRSITGSSQIEGQCGYTNPITYGPCEAYGDALYQVNSGTQCSGTYTQSYIDYAYNSRKKIYVNGSWDGSSYTTSGCGVVTERSITSSSQVDGSCGYTNPVTYGSCQAYGDAIGSSPVGGGSYCSGTYLVTYQTWQYNARRTILVNGVWDGYSYDYNCGTTTQEIIVSNTQVDGQCGYTAPPQNQWYCTESYNGGGVGNCSYTMPGYDNSGSGTGYSRQCVYGTSYPACQSTDPAPSCTCNYTDMGSYHYAPECCPSGSVRAGSLGGYSSGSCCPNVNKTQKWQCKSYDVTNSASANYSTCYYVGECAANFNSDGSRTVCYV